MKKKLFLKIFNILCYILFAFVVIYLIIAFKNFLNGEETSLFGYKLYVVETDSMEPTLKVGSVLIEKQSEYDDLDIATIITYSYREGDRTIINTHRIINYYYSFKNSGETVYAEDILNFKTADEFYAYYNPDSSNSIKIVGYITKGDNPNANTDLSPVLFNQVKSIFVKESNILTAIYGIFKSFWGLLMIIIIPTFLIVILQIYSMIKSFKMKKTEEEILKLENELSLREEEIKKKAIEDYIKAQDKN